MRILLIEDDSMLGESLASCLRDVGHVVEWATDGITGAAYWHGASFDLLLLDLGLPRKDGLAVLREGRSAGLETNVLILTARDEVPDRVAGLDAGADDYLVKPFLVDELMARVRALNRRRPWQGQSHIEHLGLHIDPATRLAQYQGQPLMLTRREYALLLVLLEQPGRVWTKEQLIERVYGWDQEIASNALEVHIHALRKKLSPDFIKNARGVGFYTPKQ